MAMTKGIVLFLIDGMRPDGLMQADTPIMDKLISSGAHTFTARTVMPSSTLPCLASLFLGVYPEQHGITGGTWTQQAQGIPGIIDVIKKSGVKAASFYNWEQLRDLSRPGSLDISFFLENDEEPDGVGDLELAELTATWLKRKEVGFAFVYFGHTDIAGHRNGWMSEPYLRGIANADRCLGRVLEALSEDWTVIVTSDHGGHEKSHGTECEEDMVIPFIINSPGIPAGLAIERAVNITDIAPTVTGLLDIESPAEWTGNAIRSM